MKFWTNIAGFRRDLFIPAIVIALVSSLSAQTASWRSTTKTSRWVDNGTLTSTAWTSAANCIEIFPDTLYQTIEGFGGCFSEKGWDPIAKLNAAKQDSVIRALFDTSGCNFNNCRLPIGANDFAENLSYYSLDDSSGDCTMSKFNLCRDSLRIIPFAKAALAYQPNLVVWASPWTPPAWMNTNGKYYDDSIKQDAQTLNAYSLYLEKAIKAFKTQGIAITALSAQNEPTQGSGSGFPTCIWTCAKFSNFYKNYLIPRFKKDSINVKLIWGTFCCGGYADWITTPFKDTALLNNISVFGLQHTESAWASQIGSAYPGKKIFQTETDCCHNNGTNDWSDGVNQFDLLATFLNDGAVQYSEWNMVLDKSGLSGWGWKQASMITIDTSAKTIMYNPSFYGVKHFTHYIKPNARRIKLVNSNSSYKGGTFACLNPDGSIVLIARNEAATAYALTVKLGNRMFAATLPADSSFNTFVIQPQVSVFNTYTTDQGVALISGVHLRKSMLFFAVDAKAHIDAIDFAVRDLKGKTIWSGHRSGVELHSSTVQAIAIKTKTGGIPSGCYLLDATIKSAGASMKMAMKISTLY